MDMKMIYERAVARVDEVGFQGFLEELESYSMLGLYKLSTDWHKDRTFVLKAKGTDGDLIIKWYSHTCDKCGNGMEGAGYKTKKHLYCSFMCCDIAGEDSDKADYVRLRDLQATV